MELIGTNGRANSHVPYREALQIGDNRLSTSFRGRRAAVCLFFCRRTCVLRSRERVSGVMQKRQEYQRISKPSYFNLLDNTDKFEDYNRKANETITELKKYKSRTVRKQDENNR